MVLKEEYLLGKVDSKDFFMSETFSDVVIECEGANFPIHRLILAGALFLVDFKFDGLEVVLTRCHGYLRNINFLVFRKQSSFQGDADPPHQRS